MGYNLAGYAIWASGIFVALAVLGIQAFVWLKSGVWPSWDIWSIWFAATPEPPQINWIGLRKALYWLFDLPLALVIFGASTVVGLALARD